MISLPPVKRGDTFAVGCLAFTADRIPQDLTDVEIQSQIRRGTASSKLQDLTVTKADQSTNPGEFSLVSMSTDDWPIGTCYCDIQFVLGEVVISSETIEITVLRDITYG